ncbi:MAG: AAA family ATPase [Proteobacteria bacterium]|nr:AAA family ATPase [Pseudomonadota bacterium]
MAGKLSSLLAKARREAQLRGQRVSTAHVLLSLWQHDATACALLSRRGVSEIELLQTLRSMQEEPESAIELVVERAHKLAASHSTVPGAAHLLAALAREPRSAARRCLDRLGCEAAALREEVLSRLARPDPAGPSDATATPKPRARRRLHGSGASQGRTIPPRQRVLPLPKPRRPSSGERPLRTEDRPTPASGAMAARSARQRAPVGRGSEAAQRGSEAAPREPFELDPDEFPALSALGRNLSALAAAGQIDPVIGRDAEVEQLLDVLARRRSNNPLLVGPPGVGKTAIVEGLALKLATRAAGTAGLNETRIVELSAGALVAGSGVRGALAERLASIKAEAAKGAGRLWLFLDEIHALIGAPAGPDDVANELKSALARGSMPCIGATTETEYRRIFERDAALARRFTRIDIAEPSAADAERILTGLAQRYESHHGVRYAPGALAAAVQLSVRYLQGRQLPDKAIGVMDQAAARVRRRGGKTVELASVARVIAEQAKVPVERLLMQDTDKLMSLEAELGARVVGQARAVAAVAATLRKTAAGFCGGKPLATFLFLGPTGVGKTALAKAVSEAIFPAGRMTRLDMSEYSEAHAVARLLGAPPGYVGHEDGGLLTEAVRMSPYQLVLFDEIEKAHPEVLLSLLALLDEGSLTDSRGRKVDFSHTVIVMTSNLGSKSAATPARIGFGAPRRDDDDPGSGRVAGSRDALAGVRAALPPELWNRIDEPLWFEPLGREQVAAIAGRLVRRACDVALKKHGVTVRVEASAIDALMRCGGFDPELGARPMRRTVGRLIEAPLAARILEGQLGRGDQVLISAEGGRLQLNVTRGSERS